MRHGIKTAKLNRSSAHRKSMLANLAVSLFEHEQITTTLPRAKSLKAYADKLVTVAKKGTLAAKKQAISEIKDQAVVAKLFDTIAKRYETRNGGYTRVMKFGFRQGDCAPMAVIELVDRDTNAKGLSDFNRLEEEAKLATGE